MSSGRGLNASGHVRQPQTDGHWLLSKNAAYMDTIHHVSDTIINTLSVSLNGILLYLVLNHSSFHVPEYLLAVASINDIVLGLAVLYGQPAILFADGYYAFVPNGFFANKSWFADYLSAILLCILIHVNVVCLVVQFIYRYRFMSQHSSPHADKFAVGKLVVIPIFYTCGHAIITMWMAYQPKEFAQVVRHVMELNQWPIREDQKFYAAGARITDLKTILYTAYYTVTTTGGYAIILWCEYKIIKELRYFGENMRESTRQLHVEVHRALIALAVAPLFVLLLPIVYFLVMIFLQATPGPISAFMTTVVTLITLANPITTICIVRPYRRAFLRMIGFGNKIGASVLSENARGQDLVQVWSGRLELRSDFNALDAKFLSVLEQQDDQWTQFGKFVGASLSQKSDKKKQRELCMKIHQLLNEYDSD
ncbi:serpentine type 7TM GPCR chemoreceptor srd domain-containing protein [Ditylenchus destructor]|uniref:Serpentine type 7TM GPCR chemoreceptor srd domain-containing protein n=1 Tax=Ditylenchus destructor TaxID=166010 RepID=A0AAD4MSA7_9BILA|nr:serpentine type 7TM GPCR chemoreceptor srd domain-containing protein [Ditylenchus destructor]